MSFDELVIFFTGDFDSQLQAGYITGCLLALVLCFVPWGRMRRGDTTKESDPRTRLAERGFGSHLHAQAHHASLRHRAAQVSERGRAWMEGPGPGAVLHLLVFVGTATAGLIGWRIPAEIERLYGDGAGFGLIFPNVTMPTIGRLAQVIGALTFAVVALRFLRLLVPVMALVTAAILLVLAVQYVAGTRFLL